MLALSMVVDHRPHRRARPGRPIILRPSRASNVGAAFEAGIAIVILAIVLDRLTERGQEASTHGRRRDRSRRDRRRRGSSSRRSVAIVLAIAVVVGARAPTPSDFPSAISVSFVGRRSTTSSDWIKTNIVRG